MSQETDIPISIAVETKATLSASWGTGRTHVSNRSKWWSIDCCVLPLGTPLIPLRRTRDGEDLYFLGRWTYLWNKYTPVFLNGSTEGRESREDIGF